MNKKESAHLKTYFNSLVHVMLFRYTDESLVKSNEDFEKYIKKSVERGGENDLSKLEASEILKHFKKEIFPLDKKTLRWMRSNLKSDHINYFTKWNEIKKILGWNPKLLK